MAGSPGVPDAESPPDRHRMPLPFFKRSKTEAVAPEAGPPMPGDEDLAVQSARTRARRRLIGAVVLLAAGIVGFPILFETQPRPLPADLPIQLAASGGTAAPATAPPVPRAASRPLPPLPTPPADAGNEPAAAPASGASTPAPVEAPPGPVIAARPAIEEPAAAKVEPARPASAPASKPAAEPAPARVTAVADKPKAPASAAQPARPASAAVAESKAATAAASAPKTGRYVVQVGAFTDPASLRDARQRVEKLGFKSYTQVVETPAGARTRVRVGPFDTREEAERAGARLKGAGLPANLLTL